MASRVVHFEIPSENPERAATFYTAAFGWQIKKWDGPQEYWLVDTGEGEPGINGGIMRRAGPFDRVINTVNVDDVDASIRRVKELGGTLVGDKMTIPDIGYLQYAQDPDGNVFGMMQPVTSAVQA
jgi:predicted enzyme related to lactoylglutathione lyase